MSVPGRARFLQVPLANKKTSTPGKPRNRNLPWATNVLWRKFASGCAKCRPAIDIPSLSLSFLADGLLAGLERTYSEVSKHAAARRLAG